MIEPTVGRVVWYHDAPSDPFFGKHGDTRAAVIAAVLDVNHVNLTVFAPDGSTYARRNVYLNQDDANGQAYPFAEWMPYQKGQAAKTESLLEQIGKTQFTPGECPGFGPGNDLKSPQNS